MQNKLTDRLNLEWPIFQAPMAEYSPPELAAAVSNAGGLGALGMWGFSADDVAGRIAGFREQSSGSLNVNYPLWDDPGDLTGIGLPMREQVQKLYYERELGIIPTPRPPAYHLICPQVWFSRLQRRRRKRSQIRYLGRAVLALCSCTVTRDKVD